MHVQPHHAPLPRPRPSSFAREWRRYDRMLGTFGRHALSALALNGRERVLDVGCGAGGSTLDAANRVGPRGSALGIDVDGFALAVAERRATELGYDNVFFLQADAGRAPLDGSFDAIVSRFGLNELASDPASLSNLARALRPGGQLAFVCARELSKNAWASVPLGAVAAIVPELADAPQTAFDLADPDHVRDLVSRGGFTDVVLTPLDEAVWVGDDIDEALEFFFETDGASLDAVLDASGFTRLTRALRLALAPYRSKRGVWLPAAAWLVTARVRPLVLQ